MYTTRRHDKMSVLSYTNSIHSYPPIYQKAVLWPFWLLSVYHSGSFVTWRHGKKTSLTCLNYSSLFTYLSRATTGFFCHLSVYHSDPFVTLRHDKRTIFTHLMLSVYHYLLIYEKQLCGHLSPKCKPKGSHLKTLQKDHCHSPILLWLSIYLLISAQWSFCHLSLSLSTYLSKVPLWSFCHLSVYHSGRFVTSKYEKRGHFQTPNRFITIYQNHPCGHFVT